MTEGKLWIEKRRHPRLNLSFPVDYRLIREGKETDAKEGKGANISRGGIRLVVGEEIKVGAMLGLKIILPDGVPPVGGKAEVVWSQEKKKKEDGATEYHIGLKFVELESKGQDLVSRFMTENLKKMSGL